MNRLIKSVLAFTMSLSVLTFTPNTLHASSEPAMYPSVQNYETSGNGSFALTDSSRFIIIANDSTIHNEELEDDVKLMSSEYLAKGLTSKAMNIHVGLESDVQAGDVVIVMETITETAHPEGYKIELGDTATITAPNTDGLFYGMRALQRGLIANDESMPNGTIVDYPGTNERAFHLDAARKWFGKDWIESLVKDLSYQGFNKLQFHFSENEGFRIESDTCEQLSGWRYPSDGYYTKAEMLEIIELCNQYHIDFYPSLDSPGHLDYILNFMPTSWDITDKWSGDWRSTQVFDIFDEPEAKQFLLDLFEEFAVFFSEAGCKYFNIGGDEFLNNFALMSNDQYIQVIDYFNEVAALVKSYGMTPRVWNDGVMYGDYTGYELDDDIEICYWSCPNACATIGKFMEEGHSVINYADTFMYFALNSWWMNNANASGEKIYTQWHPGKTASAADYFDYPYPEQLLGASYALWCDEPNFMSKENVASHLMMRTRAMMERSWNPTKAVGSYSTFEALATKVGRVAGYQSDLPEPGSVTYTENIGKVTLKYVDVDGNTLLDDKQVYGMLDTDYDLTEKAVVYGYRVVETSAPLTGTYSKDAKEIVITFELYTDKTELESYVNNKLVEAEYIAETFAEYKEAYASAVEVYNQADVHQSVVDAAIKAVKEALAKVVKLENYPLYVETAYPLQNSGYVSGYNDYKAAVEAGKAVLYNEAATAEEIKSALNVINNAKNNLVQSSSQSGISVSASVGYYTSYSYSNMLDGNESTKCWFGDGQVAGDTVTFTFNNAVNMTAIKIVQPSDVGADAILGADIKVAGADGVYKTVGKLTSADLTKEFTFDETEVKTVKIELTATIGNWYQISEVSFGYEEINTDSSLKDTILEAEALNVEGKEAAKVATMVNALIDAQKVYANGGAGVDETIALRAAIDALLDGEVNKAPLAAMIAQADSKVETQYTPSSWAAMQEVYAKAVALNENEEAVQAEVSALVIELNQAIKALVKRGDKTELAALIDEAQAMDIERATAESKAVFNDALSAAREMMDNAEATQSEVNATLEALEAAVNGLDFGQLKAENLINKSANSSVTIVEYSSQYSPDSQQASKVLDYNNSSFWHSDWSGADVLPQHILFDLGDTYNLTDITFLPRQGQSYNGDILEAQVWIGDSKDELKDAGTYTFKTTGTGVGLQLADRSEFKRLMLENAVGRYVKFVVTKSAADTIAGQNCWATMSEIRFYGTEPSVEPETPVVNKDALAAAIAAAEALVADEYTEESWAAVAEALEAAKAVAAKEDATQEEVDAAVASLEAAIAQLETKPEEPELVAPLAVENLKAVDKAYNKVSLTWDASEGATSYDVYQKAHDSEKFELVATVSEAKYTAIVPMTGKENKFYVVAKNEAGEADASEVVAKATTLHGTVKLNMKKVSTAKFELSWNKIDGATRYIIYSKRGTDEWKKVLTLGKDKLSYVTAELPNGEYSYIIRAARYDSSDRVMTAKSNAKTGTVEAIAPTVTVKVSGTKATLTWNKLEGVTYYQVLRKTSKEGKYTVIKTTSAQKYTANVSKTKTYYFKVRGYKAYKSGANSKYNVYTPYSAAKAVKGK